MQIGIELEYWIVDADGNLASVDGLPADDAIETEFVDQLLEVKTPPCETLGELREVLVDRLERALAVAGDRRLVPLGTPLRGGGISCGSDDRIEIQRAVLGDDFAHATNCAGTHVHFEGVEPDEQLRALTALDPAFALVNTTPYHRGERLVTCARPYAYRRLCYRTSPEHGQIWRYPDSVAEWRERRDERYEAFVETAADAGYDRETVRAAFDPDDAVWSPVRLRDDFGTVEWRAPDTALPSSVLRLVADLQTVMERAVDGGTETGDPPGIEDGRVRVPPFDTLESIVDVAMKRGLDSSRVVRYLQAFEFRVDSYRPTGIRIDGLDRVSSTQARQLRLHHAERLERDVRELADLERPLPA